MTLKPIKLPDDPALMQQFIEQLVTLVEKQGRDIERYKQTIEKLQRLQFGQRSEKLDPLQQVLGFASDSARPDTAAPAEPAPPATPDSNASASSESLPPKAKKGHGRRRIPDELTRITIEHRLSPDERMCPCGQVCEHIGQETSEQLDYVPSSLVAVRHVRFKYGCDACEGRIAIAPVPAQVIDKGLAGGGLLAHVITSKYADHLPFHRLERILERSGYRIARSTMCDWIDLCADLLMPIVARMWTLAFASWVLHTDDTTVPVQDEAKHRVRLGRLWVYCGDVDHPYTLYEYSPDHSEVHPIARLKDYRGHIQADGYSAYSKLCDGNDRHLVACWAHARRYFFDAQGSDQFRATMALAFIQELYAIEKKAKEDHLTAEARQTLRQELSVPVLKRFKAWLDEHRPKTLSKTPLGEALTYTLNRWTDLERFTTDGRLKIDNGVAERAMRDIAIGRKNWLFTSNDVGGHRAAVLYSIVQTCKRNGINVFEYLRDVLERVSTHPSSRIDELLPDSKWRPQPSLVAALLKTHIQK